MNPAPAVYGVFLRPDVLTAMSISTITFHVERQFGFVSAGAFPPHATLAGSVPIVTDEAAVVAALDAVLHDRNGFTVHNSGILRRSVIAYDVDRLPDGTPNADLHALALDVNAALEPLAVDLDAILVDPFRPERFHAHLSLASHELIMRPELGDDVEQFIREIPAHPSASFMARSVTLYRFEAADWSGPWWESLSWQQVQTWNLRPDA